MSRQAFFDPRQALRRFRRHPWSHVLIVGCLAVGIGVASAVLGLAQQLFRLPAPGIDDGEGLVILSCRPVELEAFGGRAFSMPMSFPDFQDIRAQARSFTHLAGFEDVELDLASDVGPPRRSNAQMVTADFFRALRLQPALGRLWGGDGGPAGSEGNVVVLSHRLWETRWGGSEDAIGQVIRLNGQPFEIVGVAPRAFRGPFHGHESELWIPLGSGERLPSVLEEGTLSDPSEGLLLGFVGRLADSTPVGAAQSEVDRIASLLAADRPDRPLALDVYPGTGLRPGARSSTQRPLALVATGMLLVFLVTCTNIAGLMLVQSTARLNEFRLRRALGARRFQLLGLLASEAFWLGLSAALGSLLVVLALGEWLGGLRLASHLPPLPGLAIDATTLVPIAVLAVLATLGIHAIPVLQLSSGSGALSSNSPNLGESPFRRRIRESLVVLQVATAFLLLAATWMVTQAVQDLGSSELGFEGETVLSVTLDLRSREGSEAAARAFFEQVLESARSMANVHSATLATAAPLGGLAGQGAIAEVVPDPSISTTPSWLPFNVVADDYFSTLGTPLLEGEAIPRAGGGSEPVVVINQQLRDTLLPPGGTAAGRSLRISGVDHRILGVVPNLPMGRLEAPPEPYFYLPLASRHERALFLHLRATSDPRGLLPELASRIAALDPGLPLADPELLSDRVDVALARPRFLYHAFVFAGFFALLLMGISLYSSLAFGVLQRRQEIGVRMALGADRGRVMFMFLARGLLLACCGVVIGGLASRALEAPARHLLEGATGLPMTGFLGLAGLILLVTVFASFLPARRSASLDPVSALRTH